MSAEVIGAIVVPLVIAFVSVVYAAIRAAIRFAQYMVRSEEAQATTAKSVTDTRDLLSDYMKNTDKDIQGLHDRLLIVEYHNRIPGGGIDHDRS